MTDQLPAEDVTGWGPGPGPVPPPRKMSQRTTLVLAACIVLVGIGAIIAAISASNAPPVYSARMVHHCNARMVMANAAYQLAQQSDVFTGMRYMRQASRILHGMKQYGCPNGPYPLHTRGQ